MNKKEPSILQIGLGAFGWNHLCAWQELGVREHYWLAETDAVRRERAVSQYGLARDHVVSDYRQLLDRVDIVDVVTPTDSHFALCREALEAGKDVFVEKPMTMDATQAREVSELVRKSGRVLQVGYYYRCHPTARKVKTWLDAVELGQLRYLSGSFMGFKRARTDVGVTHTDAVHFIDLFNWLLDAFPHEVYAVTRDHFKRGLEDWSLVLLHYPGDVVAKVESGYIQPGRWRDKVVPNAFTTKEIAVCGRAATAEVDFEQETVQLHRVCHENRKGVWTAVVAGSETPNVGTAAPIQMIATELQQFLDSVRDRSDPDANARTAGLGMAHIVEAIYASARSGKLEKVSDLGMNFTA